MIKELRDVLACVCGETAVTGGPVRTATGPADPRLARCACCGVVRVAEWNAEQAARLYRSGHYHEGHQDTVVGAVYAERFEHDREIAKARLQALADWVTPLQLVDIPIPAKVLDVGCANGAFVLEALRAGFDAQGIDLYIPEPAKPYREELTDRLKPYALEDAGFSRRYFDFVFLNDVIEHVDDPRLLLRRIAGVLKRNGTLVMDTPDFSSLDDNHHVKPVEHIWYLTPEQWTELLVTCGFENIQRKEPIPGKVVFYARVNREQTLQVRVDGPTGVGDMYWLLLKLGALRESEAPCTVKVVVPGQGDPARVFRAKEFLELVPMIDELATEQTEAVMMDDGAVDLAEPHYRLIPNWHLELGKRIETWMPHLRTDFNFPITIPDRDKVWADKFNNVTRNGIRLVAFYLSSAEWNLSVANGRGWVMDDWLGLALKCNAGGVIPVLIGKDWDAGQAQLLRDKMASRGVKFFDLIGATTVGQVLALYKKCAAVVGMCSGITILCPHVGVRSISFWPKKGNLNTAVEFDERFQHDWVDPRRLEAGDYVSLSLGEFSLQTVVEQLQKWGVFREGETVVGGQQ